MKKYLIMVFSALIAVALVGKAVAAVTEGTFGGQNSSKQYRMSVDSSGAITLADDSTLSGGTININGTVGATTPAAGSFTTLTATGVITDTAVYSKSSSTYTTRPIAIGVDGSFYGNRTSNMLVDGATIGSVTPAAATVTTLHASGAVTFDSTITDTALYSKASGTYPVNIVAIGADGTIYGAGTGTAVYGSGIYGASAGTGSAKQVWITADGKIYAP